jgi:hypothetical protein
MTTVVDLSRSDSTAHDTVGDNQPAYVTTIVLRLSCAARRRSGKSPAQKSSST